MNEVFIKDKYFSVSISSAEISHRIQELQQIINDDYIDKNPLFLPVLNGAFIFAADLVRGLHIQPEIRFIRVSTYGDEMASSHQAKVTFGLEQNLSGRHVLIVEDIVDTGYTSDFLRKYLEMRNVATVKMVTLLYKPQAFKGTVIPEYVGFEIEPKFVVGYGLDYAQRGRELPNIYTLKDA